MAWKETSGSSPFIPVDPYPGSYPNQAPNAAGLGGAGGVYSRTGASFVSCGSSFAPGSTVTTLIFAAGNGTQLNLVDNATNGGAFTIPNACTSQPNNWNAGRGTGFHSVDGSMLQFTADSPVLDWNPNGTAPGTSGRGRALVSGNLVFPNGLTYRIDNSNVSWMRDRNGNKIVLNYSNGPQYALDWYVSVPAPTQIVDSLNRTTSINYNNSSCGGCTTITYPGAGGASRIIQIRLANLSNGLLRSGSVSQMGALFPEGFQTTYNFDPILASSIQFPDNSQYSFRYDSYGEIARVNLPTGGAVEYDFGDGHNGSRDGFEGTPTDSNPVMIYRRLQERREYAAGGSAMTARTHYTVGYPASETTDADIAYDAAGHTLTQTTHTMAGSPLDALTLTGTGCNAWNEGMEIQTDIGSPKITVQNALASQSGCMSNAQVATKTTTLTDTNQVSKSTYAYDRYNNVTDQKDYDWGTGNPGPLLRETQSIYLWAHNVQQYTAPNVNLVQAPYSQAVLDGSRKQFASTLWYYDDYSQNALQDVPGAAGHDSGYATAFVPRGNLTSLNRWVNTSNSFVGTYLTYDVAGNILSVQDQNGHTSRLSYNDDGSSQYALPTSSTNALGQTSSSRYDYNIVQPAYTIDPNGQRTNYSYSDLLDRLTQMQLPNGGTIAYSHPSVTQMITQQDQSATGDGALKSRTLLDGFGRAVEADSYENASQYIAATTTYDALGRVLTTTNPSRPGDGLNYASSYGYDSLGRETGVTMPDGTTATTTYTGNQTRVTDAAGHARIMVRDALGRTTQVVEDPAGLNYSTVYAYDPSGNLTQVTQGGKTRSFVYDSLSRLLQATNPESGTVSYAYDGVGNLLQKRDNRGITTQYSYDALNRPTQQTYSDGTPGVTYSYDAASAANGKGQLTGISNGTSIISFTGFDAIGNVVASKQTTAGQTYAFSYGYNLAGTLVSETYPSGRVLQFAYDGANRPVNLGGTLNGVRSTYAAAVTYAPHGRFSVLPYGNGLTQHNWYDSRLRPQTLRSALNDQASNTYLQMNLSWNANNALGALSNNNGGPGYASLLTFTQNFAYDNLNRLASATDSGGWSRSFQYDSHGNMWLSGNSGAPLAGNTPTANVFTAANQISGASYDGAGNQTAVNGNTVAYDAENRIVSVTEPANLGGAIETFNYDGAGHRVQKSMPSGTTVYVYDAFGQLAAEYATTVPFTTPCATCYLTADHLGSTRLVTDASANVITRHDFLPFGEELPGGSAGRNSQWAPGGDNVEEKFTGQMRDQETGLDYFNARYLGAALGRFTSPDPGNAAADPNNPQSWNGYAYGLNNPLANVDPSGMDAIAPGDPDFPDPCGGDPFCGWWPLPLPPVFTGGSGGGGGNGSGSGSGQTADKTPFPPNSFPGGETLGVPPGMKIPNPLSPQILLGLDASWDCSTGICVPGLGALNARPAWLNNVTSIFGYDQNIPLKSCFVDVALTTAFDDVNPFAPGLFDIGQGIFQTGSAIKFNQALTYAAKKGLTYPNKSSVFRHILKNSGSLGKVADVLPLVNLDYALTDGFIAELKALNRGGCQ